MYKCNMCGDLKVNNIFNGLCHECIEEVAVIQEDLDNQSDLYIS